MKPACGCLILEERPVHRRHDLRSHLGVLGVAHDTDDLDIELRVRAAARSH